MYLFIYNNINTIRMIELAYLNRWREGIWLEGEGVNPTPPLVIIYQLTHTHTPYETPLLEPQANRSSQVFKLLWKVRRIGAHLTPGTGVGEDVPKGTLSNLKKKY